MPKARKRVLCGDDAQDDPKHQGAKGDDVIAKPPPQQQAKDRAEESEKNNLVCRHTGTMFAMAGQHKGNAMAGLPDIEKVEVRTVQQLWDWLEVHHAPAEGILLITWKAAHKDRYVGREAVLDAVVAYGWVDGRRYGVDADRTAQLLTPRKTQVWAQSYKDRVARLDAEGQMRPSGWAAVAAGKASGLWDAMADVDRLEVPPDLDAALGAGRAAWDALAPSYRRNVLRWIKLAKTAPTRTKRITAAAQATAKGQKIQQM